MRVFLLVTECLLRIRFHLFVLAAVLHPVLGQDVPEADVDSNAQIKEPIVPCSCDCCLVAERAPSEMVTLPGGEELTRKCVAPPVLFETDTCGQVCTPSSAEIVLTSVKENMDMNRFCTFNCRPSTKTVGTICNIMRSQDIADVFTFDGNGNADTKAFMPPINEETSWGGPSSNKRLEDAQKQNEENEKLANKLKEGSEGEIKYDITEVISNRKRSEAAGNIARAAAAEASTKANAHRAQRKRADVERVLTALQESAGFAGSSQVEAAQAAQDATVAAADARAALAQARVLAKNAAASAKELAREEIKKAAAAAAKEEGSSDAYRFGWDKPPNWAKVVAQTMSVPYLSASVGASWRASEYESYAKGILGKAKAAQGQARAIHAQANQYAAVGDTMRAKMMDVEVKNLISKSHNLEAQAEAEWKRADDVQRSVSEWQQAGLLAAGHAGWAWANYFTPPPPIDQVPYHLRPKIRLTDWVDKSKR